MPRAADLIVRRTATEAQATAVANAPVDTGFHRSSIGWDHIGPAQIEFGPTSNYGAHLEFGTWRMEPRPHIIPAMDDAIPGAESGLGQISETLILGGR